MKIRMHPRIFPQIDINLIINYRLISQMYNSFKSAAKFIFSWYYTIMSDQCCENDKDSLLFIYLLIEVKLYSFDYHFSMQVIENQNCSGSQNSTPQIPLLPFQTAQKHYRSWQCPIETIQINQVYYKYLHGHAKIQYTNGNIFEGQIEKGLYQGQGEFHWKDTQIRYKGNFQRNAINGKGQFTYPNGSYYRGQLQNGMRHGYGQFYKTSENNSTNLSDQTCSYTYVGQWANGKRQGFGKIVFQNGSSYEGEWKNDFREGKGKIIYASGNEYEGQWKEDNKCGNGTMTWASNHQKYKGSWRDNMPNGYGECYWYENRTQYKIIKNLYKGLWKNGKREGFGAFYYANGYKFQGEFSENKKNGWGLTIDEYGLCKLNQYYDDRPASLLFQPNKKTHTRQSTNSQLKSESKLPKLTKNPLKESSSINYLNMPVENQYKKCLDFSHSVITENFYNFLLRLNSRFIGLYKNIAAGSIDAKDFYSGMMLENFWRIVRDSKILSIGINNSENLISLAEIDRAFAKGKRSYYNIYDPPKEVVLNILKQNPKILQQDYQDIVWGYFFEKVRNLDLEDSQAKQKILFPDEYLRDIHNPQEVILFRHFICLLVQTSILLNPPKSPQSKIKATLQQMVISMESLYDPNTSNMQGMNSRPQKSAIQSHITIQRHVYLPEWTEEVHNDLLSVIFREQPNLFSIKDHTISLNYFYCLLDKCNIFKDINEKIIFIQKIEKWLNIRGILSKKEIRNHFISACLEETQSSTPPYQKLENVLKFSPYFKPIMSYELNAKEIKEVLFQTISRKIMGGSSQQQFRSKYKKMVESLITCISQSFRENQSYLKLKKKQNKTYKDIQKQNKIKQVEKQKREEEQRRQKEQEEQREQTEQELMKREDFDAPNIDDLNQQQDSEDGYYL